MYIIYNIIYYIIYTSTAVQQYTILHTFLVPSYHFSLLSHHQIREKTRPVVPSLPWCSGGPWPLRGEHCSCELQGVTLQGCGSKRLYMPVAEYVHHLKYVQSVSLQHWKNKVTSNLSNEIWLISRCFKSRNEKLSGNKNLKCYIFNQSGISICAWKPFCFWKVSNHNWRVAPPLAQALGIVKGHVLLGRARHRVVVLGHSKGLRCFSFWCLFQNVFKLYYHLIQFDTIFQKSTCFSYPVVTSLRSLHGLHFT